jgi:hypothetical protein
LTVASKNRRSPEWVTLSCKVFVPNRSQFGKLNLTRRLPVKDETRGSAQESKAEVFDVFLCHNSEDKPAVREISQQLVSEGIKPWLDDEQIKPGTTWQATIGHQIESIKSAAVFIGESGVGPWQDEEVQTFLSLFVKRKSPIIPVILPSAKTTPKLPWTMENFHWVDFRVPDPDPLQQLIWGITRERPTRKGEKVQATPAARPLDHHVGPSTHIATDIWTLRDSLGFRAYAHAISRFMTHPQTSPPLTVSIQAPWGGGKTTLMRMIQQALDPEALQNTGEKANPEVRGELKIRGALDEVDAWIQAKTQKKLPLVPEKAERKLLTVWFNAWKYESTNQIWAGLGEAIMQQIAARLSTLQRELFWLRLNLKRIDADKIRQRVHERVFKYWWRATRSWLLAGAGALVAFGATTMVGTATHSEPAKITGWVGFVLSVLASAIVGKSKFEKAKEEVKEEPAAVSLGEFLEVPSYSNEFGFIHRAEADLRRVLASVPGSYWPIVIFIDDLDRCSPAKVGQVMEAINLFLAGDFPKCMFVIGMDTEMVAAALQAAHKDVITCLPLDAGIPVGWRFMDKFVQLPFLIPPAEPSDINRYTTALFSNDRMSAPDSVINVIVGLSEKNVSSVSGIDTEVRRLQEQHRLSEEQAGRLKEQLVILRKLDEGIDTFTDQNPTTRDAINAGAKYFGGNPRELKRFINSFRFQYFLWWARRAQNQAAPELDQLVRWTVLSVKWPEVVRWMRRSRSNEFLPTKEERDSKPSKPEVRIRLGMLEDVSGDAKDLLGWQETAKTKLRLDPESTSWLRDDDLFGFFSEESRRKEGTRLSDAAGKGLW